MLATDTWTGAAGDGLWSTAGNWDNGVPNNSTDDVHIGAGANVTLSSTNVVHSLTIASGATLSVDNGGKLKTVASWLR
ncbi:MAG TPA: hypothetical protein VFW87_16440, partial [Pirellulales bacterium]|nr:hypothetical protein [Pirellulales bacterium]